MMQIFVRTSFEGFHCWPCAPDEVAFLRNRHRHIFHVEVVKDVTHNERDIEFILFKGAVDDLVNMQRYASESENWSCEKWAEFIGDMLDAKRVTVSEDNENGAIYTRE